MDRRSFIQLLAAFSFGTLLPRLRAAPPAGEMRELVRESIQRQRVMKLNYGGFDRLVEPHALGTTAGGHAAMLAWQFEGGSRSGPPVGWRLFVLAEVRQATVTVRGFTPRPTYRRDGSPLRTIEFDVFGDGRDVAPSSET